MNRKRNPKVSPLPGYPQPAYPSHRDPEPKAYLHANPYPFAGTLAGGLALGALGVFGAGAGEGEAGESASSAAPEKARSSEFCLVCAGKSFQAGKGKCTTCGGKTGSPQMKHCATCAEKKSICRMCGGTAKELEHPFYLASGGFPIRPIHFGTGQPAHLGEQDVRPVVEKLFKEAGVKLAADVDPKLEGVSAELDGWDAKKKIGFEYVYGNDYDYYPDRDLSRMTADQRKRIEEGRARSLSFAEIQKLEGMAGAGKVHVAAINYKKYPYGPMAVYNDPELQAKYKELNAAKAAGDKEKQQKILAEIQKLRGELAEKSKELALKKLEQDVRGYIAWLRKHGAL